MKVKKVKAISILFALMMFVTSGICAGQNDASQFADTERDYVPNEVIVKFKDEKQVDFNMFFGRHKIRESHKVFRTTGKDARSLGLNKVYRVIFQEKLDVIKICQEMSEQPNVVYAEPNYIGRFCDTFPNDTSFGQQWALHNTGQTEGGVADADVDGPEAWDDETGSENVVIAVIDTGIKYNHPDLEDNIWHNPVETYNGNDDDGNGYVDDVIGWDFVSASQTSVGTGEDPGPPDNDPMDGHGHGTCMAGIISAVGNNGTGISGMTWKCKAMAVRAGYRRTDGSAWIQSNDAASAIMYAAVNGANVINLSWGFTSVSQTVEAAIEYAYAQGAVIVASVGNEDSETVIFPSSMDKVIAVGGTDDKDERAVWTVPQPPVPGEASNYGVGIDVAAPAKNILTTALGDSYESVQGTSASAGFTSGLAALILSRPSSFTNLEVREIIYSSADAGISPDKYIGRGRINADKALEISSVPHAEITNLQDMDMISDNFEIWGTANGGASTFKNYVLEYAQGIYPASWIQIVDSTSPVTNGVLGTWDVQDEDIDNGKYTLKLTVCDNQGNYNIKERLVFIDKDLHAGWPLTTGRNSYCHPVVGDLDNDGDMEIVVGDRDKVLHVWNHDGTLVFEKTLDGRIKTAPVLADIDIDIDNVGSQEILVASEGSSSHDSKVYLFKADGSSVDGWPQVLADGELLVLSVGDLDGNGSLEVVAASSRNPSARMSKIYIWCANGDSYIPTAWPKEIDLEMPSGVYPGQDYASTPVLADMDKDGDLEIIVSIPVYDKRTIYVWHHDGTEFSRIDETGDGDTFHCVVGDIDNNGDLEIVGTTENGRLLVWNHDASSYPGTWPNLPNGFSKPVLADLDQDKDLEIVVENNDNWVYVYHHDGENMAGWPVQVEDIMGDWAWPPLVAGDVDGDRCPEILAAGGKGKMVYIWHSDGTQLDGWPKIFPDYFKEASPVIGDLDNDGKVELFVSSNTLCVLWDLEGDYKRQDMQWPMFQHDARHTGVYTLLCKGDLDGDGDVDGSDLALFAADSAGITLKQFAEEFGRTDCP